LRIFKTAPFWAILLAASCLSFLALPCTAAAAETLLYFRPDSFPAPIRALAESTLKAAQAKEQQALEQSLARLSKSNFGRGLEDERLFLSGFSLFHLGKTKEALSTLRESLAIRGSNPEAQYYVLLSLKKTGQCQQVLKELDNLKFLVGKNHHEALILQAECLITLQRTEESKPVIADLTKLAQRLPEARQWLLKFRRSEIQSGAIEAGSLGVDLKEAAEANPDDYKVQALYARALLKKGDPLFAPEELKQAEQISKRAFEKSGQKDEQAFRALFDVLLKMRRYSEAEELLEQATISIGENSSQVSAARRQLDIERKGLDTLRFQLE
jgi:thioredoxin-like negative regulator of GroEL